MATVRMTMTGMHVPWKVGEIVTVRVATEEGDGEFTCETLETYPPDLKDQHRATIETLQNGHEQALKDLRAKHESELSQARAVTAANAPEPAEQTTGVGADVAINAQHQKDLAEHLAKQTP